MAHRLIHFTFYRNAPQQTESSADLVLLWNLGGPVQVDAGGGSVQMKKDDVLSLMPHRSWTVQGQKILLAAFVRLLLVIRFPCAKIHILFYTNIVPILLLTIFIMLCQYLAFLNGATCWLTGRFGICRFCWIPLFGHVLCSHFVSIMPLVVVILSYRLCLP